MQKLLGLLILFLALPTLASEYEILEKTLRTRYQDFYIRMNDTQKKAYETKEARKTQARIREKEQQELERVRKDYVRTRKQKVELSDAAHQRELAEREKELERARKEYVKVQSRLEDIHNKLEVPEWVEYKLYDDTIVSDSPAKSSN